MSSPLILSFDVTNDTEVERLWPIIGNQQALSINAQWAGQAGRRLKTAAETFDAVDCGDGPHMRQEFPMSVVWAKRLVDPPRSVAVLAINIANTSQSLTVSLDELQQALPGGAGAPATTLVGTDVWSGQVAQTITGAAPWTEQIHAHQSKFLVFSPR